MPRAIPQQDKKYYSYDPRQIHSDFHNKIGPPQRTSRSRRRMSAIGKSGRDSGHRVSVANDPSVWTGRVLQAGCERWRGLVLRFCIRPVNRAFMLLAIMDIRTHPISFCERP